MERPPISVFFGAKDEEKFPVLNPSKGTATPFTVKDEMPQPEIPSQDISEKVSVEPPTEEPSFFGRMKEWFTGAAKGVGEDALGSIEMAKKGARNVPRVMSGGLLPEIPEPQYSKDISQKLKGMTEAKTETEEKWKSGTQWATFLAPIIGSAITKAPGFARSLEEASLRMTASEKRDMGGKLDGAINYIVEKGITGNPSKRLEKAQALYAQTEDRLQKYLTEEAKDIKVPREIYITRLEALKSKYADDRDSQVIASQIDDAIATFRKNYADSPLIPVDRFNKWKRSVMADAFNKAGLKVRDDVEFAIGNEANEMLKDATKDLMIDGRSFAEFNKEYQNLINARKLLYKAEDKDQVDMFGKLLTSTTFGGTGGVLGTMAGGPLAGVAGGTAAWMLGNKIVPAIAGTASRSMRGQIWESVAPLSPAAKQLLGLYLLAPGKVQEYFSDEEIQDLGLPLENLKGGSITPRETQTEGKPPIESFLQ